MKPLPFTRIGIVEVEGIPFEGTSSPPPTYHVCVMRKVSRFNRISWESDETLIAARSLEEARKQGAELLRMWAKDLSSVEPT